MAYLRRPWNFLAVLFVLIASCFAVIKWHRFHTRQERLCTSSVLCRLHDIVPKEKIPPVSVDMLKPLFGQPLFFLGEGKQCVAYETADGRYVLKLFKKASKKRKQKQLAEYITGGIIARTVLPEETGVIACVCGHQPFALPVVTVLNERDRIEKIPLQDVPFIFQRKAQPLKQTLMRLLAEKKGKEAALRLESVFALLMICREKGVLDRDGSLIRNGNIGFVDGKAVLLDTGKLCRLADRKRITLHDLNRLKPLETWLQAACPELVPVFKTCLEKYRTTVSGKPAKKV
jgi:hypothetical protein